MDFARNVPSCYCLRTETNQHSTRVWLSNGPLPLFRNPPHNSPCCAAATLANFRLRLQPRIESPCLSAASECAADQFFLVAETKPLPSFERFFCLQTYVPS